MATLGAEVTCDTFPQKFQEESAMGKRLKKSEKLDLILSELVKLRGEVKKLTAVANQETKAKLRAAPGRPKQLPKRTGAAKKPNKDVAPSKPVLVQAPPVPQPTSRTASHVFLPPQSQTGAHGSTPAQSSRKPR
jgi:hypothetical protein